MDPSSQGDANGNKGKNAYSSWTNEEREVLVSLLVDATKCGWKDKNRSFSKRTIETSILPVLNQKCNCNKTHENYKGAMKWFMNRFDVVNEAFKIGPGFRINPDNGLLEAPEEVWELLCCYGIHKTHKWIRTTALDDYNDICIIFGGKATTGRITVDVSQNVTSATTCENEDKMIQDYVDSGLGNFEEPYYPLSTQPLSAEHGDVYSPILPKTNWHGMNLTLLHQRIDSKSELMGSVFCGVTSIASHIEALRAIIEEKSVDRRIEKLEKIREQKKKQCESDSVYASIMEIPDLTTDERFQAVEMFMYLSADDRNDWIRSKLNK
ncbi:hypothetical protein MKW92_002437 [Papaver armeniacum]|nr:hypothetical protein MKW92_002437 [Papaver armeniacum]